MHNRRNSQVKMRQLYFYSSLRLLVLYCCDVAVRTDLDIMSAAGCPFLAKLCQIMV